MTRFFLHLEIVAENSFSVGIFQLLSPHQLQYLPQTRIVCKGEILIHGQVLIAEFLVADCGVVCSVNYFSPSATIRIPFFA